MNIEIIRDRVNSWDNILSARQKGKISFRSIKNFVSHFDELPDESLKDNVLLYLSCYVEDVQDASFRFSSREGYDLTVRYLNNIAKIYSDHLGFKYFIKLELIVFGSSIADGLIYILTYSSLDYYFPIVFFLFLIYYLYTKIFFERKGMAYGMYY